MNERKRTITHSELIDGIAQLQSLFELMKATQEEKAGVIWNTCTLGYARADELIDEVIGMEDAERKDAAL